MGAIDLGFFGRLLTVCCGARVDGMIVRLPAAVINTVQLKLIEAQGAACAPQTLKL